MDQRLAGKRIEDEIDATWSDAASAFRESQVATAENGVRAKLGDHRLLVCTGRRNDPRAQPASDLHCGLSHSAGCGVDQRRFARLEPAAFNEAVPGCQEGDRHSSAQFRGQRKRARRYKTRVRDRIACNATGRNGDNGVSDVEALDAGTNSNNAAGAFVSQPPPLRPVQWVEVEDLEDITKIDAARRDRDGDLARDSAPVLHGRATAVPRTLHDPRVTGHTLPLCLRRSFVLKSSKGARRQAMLKPAPAAPSHFLGAGLHVGANLGQGD